MCQAKANGGRRCAAHTRPDYSEALLEVLEAPTLRQVRDLREVGHARILAHALTPTGRREVDQMCEEIYNARRAFTDA